MERQVVSNEEILAVFCYSCQAPIGSPCRLRKNPRIPLTTSLDQDDFSFHQTRIMDAYAFQLARKFGTVLTAAQKSLIAYYAFILMSNSVAAKSQQVLGREHTSLEIQTFFCAQAIEELKRDGLIE